MVFLNNKKDFLSQIKAFCDIHQKHIPYTEEIKSLNY